MGHVINGRWVTRELGADERGRFVRQKSVFRQNLSADGSTPFAAELGRYKLYASVACGWTHRVLLVRKLRGLEEMVPVTWSEAYMGPQGWTLIEDPSNGVRQAWEVYVLAQPDYTGRATVPILWDTKHQTIVSNESLDIIRSLDQTCARYATGEPLWPESRHAAIEAMIDANYESLNNGVYRAGFASSQQAHEEAARSVHRRMTELDAHLADHRWLLGDTLTMADICLFPTMYRFDAVYNTHFKCTLSRLVDFEHLWDWTRALYQLPGVAETCDLEHTKRHYYQSHRVINPSGVVPLGPEIDFDAPTSR